MAPQKPVPAFLKKITMKECKLNPNDLQKTAIESSPSEVPVLRIYGVVSKTSNKQSTLGEYILFEGGFEAINLLTGAYYRSDKLIVPGVAEMFVSKAVDAAQRMFSKEKKSPKEIAGIAGITIGCDITVIENKTSYEQGWKFKYGVSPLSNIEGKDAISELGESFGPPPLLIAHKKKA